MSRSLQAVCLYLAISAVCPAGDWPQFRGPNRDGMSTETGLLQEWPQGGPRQLWSVDGLGEGWSSAAVYDGAVYITGKLGADGWLFAYDKAGSLNWKVPYGPEWDRSYRGCRTTPTFVDGKAYIISGKGVVYCLRAADGAPLWSRDVFSEFDGKYPLWGISECLLVDEGRVVASPGGSKASIVALDKDTGEVLWACSELTEPTTYGNPRAITVGDNRLIVQMLQDSIVGVDARTGKLLWRDAYDNYHIDRDRLVTPNVPYYMDGCVYSTSGYDNGGAMHRLSSDGADAERIWTDKTLDIHHGGFVVLDGYIYGSNWLNNRSGRWCCIRWADGRTMYEFDWNDEHKGNVSYADGRLYCWDEENGDLALVEPTPEAFRIVSTFRFSPGKGMHWAHPAISDGVLYLRHGDVMAAFDIRKK